MRSGRSKPEGAGLQLPPAEGAAGGLERTHWAGPLEQGTHRMLVAVCG